MATVTYPHIELRDDGVPIISGTRMKVVQIVLDKLAHGWDAEEIQRQYPQWNLSLGQIHSALAYYYDHQVEIDRYIEEERYLAEELKASLGESPGRLKLRSRGLIP
jgi:uncharacterized protein (DUF433 family)